MAVNGTLYAGSTALYLSEPFYSTRNSVCHGKTSGQVQKIEQGQGVQVLTNNDVVYTFTGIQSFRSGVVKAHENAQKTPDNFLSR
jgi:hypothetical protein